MLLGKRTLESIRDGFGGDSYRRREVSPGVYQCGCRWVHYEEPHEVSGGIFVTGDVLIECDFHRSITENSCQ
jgi:hypothetical protein